MVPRRHVALRSNQLINYIKTTPHVNGCPQKPKYYSYTLFIEQKPYLIKKCWLNIKITESTKIKTQGAKSETKTHFLILSFRPPQEELLTLGTISANSTANFEKKHTLETKIIHRKTLNPTGKHQRIHVPRCYTENGN